MAYDHITHIPLPALDRVDSQNRPAQGRLVLTTGKDSRGYIMSSYHVEHAGNGFVTMALLGDFFGRIPERGAGPATQKKIDAQHARLFNPEVIAALTKEAVQFYADDSTRIIPKKSVAWRIDLTPDQKEEIGYWHEHSTTLTENHANADWCARCQAWFTPLKNTPPIVTARTVPAPLPGEPFVR